LEECREQLGAVDLLYCLIFRVSGARRKIDAFQLVSLMCDQGDGQCHPAVIVEVTQDSLGATLGNEESNSFMVGVSNGTGHKRVGWIKSLVASPGEHHCRSMNSFYNPVRNHLCNLQEQLGQV